MKRKSKDAQGTRPPSALYSVVAAIVRAFIWVVARFRVIEETPLPKEGPLVVLCSHQGMLDFAFAAAAVRRRMHFVAASRFFDHWLLGPFLRKAGVIPKIQFHPDPRCIASLLRITRQGGCTCLFPAGQTSMCGVPAHIPPSIVRLVRKAGATVAAANIHGSFFTMPRFATGTINRGTVEVRLQVLFTPEALAEATDEQILAGIRQAIDYNEFAWQEAGGALFRGRSKARGYEGVLYACPRCKTHYQMQSKGNRFYCTACGNAALIGTDMHMHPAEQDSVIFSTMLDWYRWQEQSVFHQVDGPDPFLLEAPAKAVLYPLQRGAPAMQGTLRMDREGISFETTIKGEAAVLAVRHSTLPGLVAETGKYLEIYNPEWGLVRYYPQNPQVVTLWKIAQEYIHGRLLAQ